jgi:hypothetical protein
MVEPDMDHSCGDLEVGQAGSPPTRPSTWDETTLIGPPARVRPQAAERRALGCRNCAAAEGIKLFGHS